MINKKMLFGCHINKSEIQKYVDKYGFKTFQVFTKSPRSSKPDIVKDYHANPDKKNINIFVHSSYLINLCKELTENSVKSVVNDLEFCKDNNATKKTGVVVHMGKNVNKVGVEKVFEIWENNFERLIKASNEKGVKNIPVLLETSVKSGNDVFYDIKVFLELFNKLKKKYKSRVGICIDTCHVFTSGYDLRTKQNAIDFLNLFKNNVRDIKLIHLNDSKVPIGNGADRHEYIGKGYIFKESKDGLEYLIKFFKEHNIPVVTETPNSHEELEYLKEIFFKY